jgi:hypothetical protein
MQEAVSSRRRATPLARIWAEQGELRKAYDLLAPIEGGFHTPDLIEDKELLDASR